jgi:hypothetical protein
MYDKYVHGHLLIFIFSGDITLPEIEVFFSEMSQASEEVNDIYVVGLLKPGTSYPNNIPEIVKSLRIFNAATKKIARIYGLRFHPIVSFISNVVTKILKLDSNTIEAKSLNELLEIIQREAEIFPNLKASLTEWEAIKAEIQSSAG